MQASELPDQTQRISDLKDEVLSLLDGRPELFWGDLANFCSHIFHRVADLNWVGFYILSGDTLYLGPFSGRPACTMIPLARGVCGASARSQRPLLVPDVHAFDGHIACDSASRSEMVVPIFHKGQVWGVLDLDSPVLDRFSEHDLRDVSDLVQLITERLQLQRLPNSRP